MLKDVKSKLNKVKTRAQFDETLKLFSKDIINDLRTTIAEAELLEKQIKDLLKSENIHTDNFVITKTEQELECIDKLKQDIPKSSLNENNVLSLETMYNNYIRITKMQKSIKVLREYLTRIKKDILIYEVEKIGSGRD
jgi:hypothetical protein